MTCRAANAATRVGVRHRRRAAAAATTSTTSETAESVAKRCRRDNAQLLNSVRDVFHVRSREVVAVAVAAAVTVIVTTVTVTTVTVVAAMVSATVRARGTVPLVDERDLGGGWNGQAHGTATSTRPRLCPYQRVLEQRRHTHHIISDGTCCESIRQSHATTVYIVRACVSE
jgi:hypothetical protein